MERRHPPCHVERRTRLRHASGVYMLPCVAALAAFDG